MSVGVPATRRERFTFRDAVIVAIAGILLLAALAAGASLNRGSNGRSDVSDFDVR